MMTDLVVGIVAAFGMGLAVGVMFRMGRMTR